MVANVNRLKTYLLLRIQPGLTLTLNLLATTTVGARINP